MSNDQLHRELSAIIRADIMTELKGVRVTRARLQQAAARSIAALMLPAKVTVEISDNLNKITILYERQS